MDRISTDYTVEQLLNVERSYYYENPTRDRVAASAGSGRTLPIKIFAAMMAVAPCTLPKDSSPALSITEIAALTQRAQDDTTESSDFRQFVRELVSATTPKSSKFFQLSADNSTVAGVAEALFPGSRPLTGVEYDVLSALADRFALSPTHPPIPGMR